MFLIVHFRWSYTSEVHNEENVIFPIKIIFLFATIKSKIKPAHPNNHMGQLWEQLLCI